VGAVSAKAKLAVRNEVMAALGDLLLAIGPSVPHRWSKRWRLEVAIKPPSDLVAFNHNPVGLFASRAPMPKRAHGVSIGLAEYRANAFQGHAEGCLDEFIHVEIAAVLANILKCLQPHVRQR
jgi:hypothetical protein